MRFAISRDDLLAVVSPALRAISATTTMPILGGVLIDATKEGDGGRITAAGCDLERFARREAPADVEEAGTVVVPGALLGQIVKLLPSGLMVTVESDGSSRVRISTFADTFTLAAMLPEDYPDFPAVTDGDMFTISASVLRAGVDNTIFAVPDRDPRKVLQGVLFELADSALTMVATDGRKLGRYVCTISRAATGEASVIVPHAFLADVLAGLPDDAGDVKVVLCDRHIAVEHDGTTQISAIIEGQYPKYDAVIPKSHRVAFDMNCDPLIKTLARAAVMAERKHFSVVLALEPGKIKVAAKSVEAGSFNGEMLSDYAGDPLTIAFNYRYLSDVLRLCPSATIQVKIKNVNAPVLFGSADVPEALWLVMPVRMTDISAKEEEAA